MPRSLPDINRRSFLKGTVGTAAAMAVSTAYSRDLLAQETSSAFAGYTFLSPSEVSTLEVIAEQIWPTDDSIGGRDAGVVTYIDRALSGAYSHFQPVYRLGLEWVDQAANEAHGDSFASLESDQQLALMEAWLGTPGATSTASPAATPEATPVEPESGSDATPEDEEDGDTLGVEGMPLPGSSGMLAGGDPPRITDINGFMSIVLTHTIEGLFADPAYGGNRDKAVWTALRYGGPYYVHTEEQQTSFEPLDLPVQSLADL
jgi:gluconate 2-dehydrogenase gamma chain